MTKKCTKCQELKAIILFYQDRTRKDGHTPWCKACQGAYRVANRDKLSEKQRESQRRYSKWYYRNNKDKSKKYKKANRLRINKLQKERRSSNINYRISYNLRCRIGNAVKNNQKGGSAINELGCSVDFFKAYIAQLFLPGMSWDNYGLHGWHLDHIIPLSSFDLTDREQFLKACHYTNYQPLWAKDNLTKAAKTESS